MTEKELHKLRRVDLLQLLLMQSKEVAQNHETIENLEKTLSEARTELDETRKKLADKELQMTENIELLKNKLNDREAETQKELDHIREKLDEKDEQLTRLLARLREQDDTISELTADLETLRAEKHKQESTAVLPDGVAGADVDLNDLNEILKLAQSAVELKLRQNQPEEERQSARQPKKPALPTETAAPGTSAKTPAPEKPGTSAGKASSAAKAAAHGTVNRGSVRGSKTAARERTQKEGDLWLRKGLKFLQSNYWKRN